MKNQAMASESHDPAALVSVVSLKCVLRVAVRAGWYAVATCTADATSEGSRHLMISSS